MTMATPMKNKTMTIKLGGFIRFKVQRQIRQSAVGQMNYNWRHFETVATLPKLGAQSK